MKKNVRERKEMLEDLRRQKKELSEKENLLDKNLKIAQLKKIKLQEIPKRSKKEIENLN